MLAGNNIDGVQLTDAEIIELNALINEIGKLDFRKIANYYANKFQFNCSPRYIQSLEWSREDLCNELG